MKKILSLMTLIILMTISPLSANNNYLTKEGFVTVPDGRIWYKIYTSKKVQDKTPLLILHGGPGVPHDYLEVFSSLANERPVIFYDQLGCGHSSVVSPNEKLWSLERYINELETLINHLQLKKIHLLGHSWGGALAIEYTLRHPKKITSLILASPLISTRLWIEDSRQRIKQLPPTIQNIILTHEQQNTTDSIEYKNAMNVYYSHFSYRTNPLPEKLTYSLDHMNFTIYKTMWGLSEFTMTGNLKDFDRFNDLKNLTMPVLITGGRFDEAIPETLTKAVKLLPHGKLIIYENSAHFAFLEEEKKYLKDIRIFLHNN